MDDSVLFCFYRSRQSPFFATGCVDVATTPSDHCYKQKSIF